MSAELLPIAVVGALGRMGRRIAALAGEHGCLVTGALVEPGDPHLGRRLVEVVPEAAGSDATITDQADQAIAGSRAVIDFALPVGLARRVEAACVAGLAYVCGVTGLTPADQERLDVAAREIPVLWAPNMSQGINALLALVAQAAQQLPGFEVEVHELHHRHKADAPSGTAIALAERAATGVGSTECPPLNLCRGRDPGPRPHEEIGVVATRGGDTVGEHVVYLFGAGERLELCHRATSRDIFVHGALRAARFLMGRSPARYSMADVLSARP